ncbi:MAG: YbhB/YbcL family Raf kinase inhibitor-like protein [Candidatus Mcinerneyibacterium aminivorans]|uniref:YbhB/YbcL family Raf kinase inhibitor-like protein n=1 Tax=Candidatus Mcinerneyibacterium aminivorans TaxID=2703815 RepID=A0A5D0MDU0_9BACT|nr:MAG: YbhB/YbcL family Raf kinase inhibitor-like protein [Candidatus Mcinerneyibacterium aminivorans]
MKYFLIGFLGVLFLIIFFVIYKRITNVADYVNPEINLEVTSNAFENNGDMPVKFTGRGEDISPQLKLDKIDSNAKSIAVIMDDLDHPIGVFNHWLIWNIPADFNVIPEGIPRKEVVPSLGNALQGRSAYGGKHYYRGPKPPFGIHKYKFKVYVLDIMLDLKKNANKEQLQKAMKGHILQYGTLTGQFGS